MKSVPTFPFVRSWLIVSGLYIGTAVALRAQLNVTPVSQMAAPVGHSYVIGVGTTDGSAGTTPIVVTTRESYVVQPSGVYSKIWDVAQYDVYLYPTSSIATTGNKLVGLGSDTEASTFQVDNRSLLSTRRLGDLGSTSDGGFPAGLTLRYPVASPGSSLPAFLSSGTGSSGTNSVPTLLYTSDIGPAGGNGTPVVFQAFGNSGPGAVSASVGALAMGPDGMVNALDVGLGKVMRYNASTLQFVSSFYLAAADTTPDALVITANGLVVTAFSDRPGGDIYDYRTGTLLGTYSATMDPGDGDGGKTSLAYDATNDRVDGYFDVNGNETFATYDLSGLTAVPEPATTGAVAGMAALGFAAWRRRRG